MILEEPKKRRKKKIACGLEEVRKKNHALKLSGQPYKVYKKVAGKYILVVLLQRNSNHTAIEKNATKVVTCLQ